MEDKKIKKLYKFKNQLNNFMEDISLLRSNEVFIIAEIDRQINHCWKLALSLSNEINMLKMINDKIEKDKSKKAKKYMSQLRKDMARDFLFKIPKNKKTREVL